MMRLKKVVQVLPLLTVFGLAGCFGSAFTDLLITSVKLTPANPTIAAGATQLFVLSATFAGGITNRESASDVTWFSDNTAVATIDKTGLVTAVAAGTAHIEGNYHANNATTLLTVTTAANVAMAVAGDSRSLQVTNLRTGQRMSFAADGLRDLIMVSRDGATNGGGGRADDAEVSVLPEHGPAWIAVDPAAKYLYVVNHTSESISVFAIDWKTGALQAIPFSPFSAGAKPWSVEVDPDGAGISVTHFQSGEVSRFRVNPASGTLKLFGEN
jgi:DNA-binding beta-propeller fold protein YncE